MDIVELTDEFYQRWDDFCLTSHDTWFWHTSDCMEYSMNYRPELKSKNLSFYFIQDNQIQVICPLFLENYESNSQREFSFGGGSNPNPAFSPKLTYNQRILLEKRIFDYIDTKAKELDVQRVRFCIRPLSERMMDKCPNSNWILQYGFLDFSLFSTIINLRKTIDEIWSHARKRIKRAINAMKKRLETNIYTSKNISDEIFENYHKMHLKAAGRSTRPQKTWDLMKDWVKNDKAILVSAEENGDEIGFALFIVYKNNAYYASGANNPEKSDLPIMHFMFWKVIEWLKKNQFNYFEVGIFSYPSLSEVPSTKENQIGHFKRGFGGDIYPLFQGEKYYSEKFCRQQITTKVNNYFNYLKEYYNER